MSDVEAEDVLSDSLQTLYGYTPITHGSAGSPFTYPISRTLLNQLGDAKVINNSLDNTSPPTISLITPKTGASNWSLHASSIWVSSLFIADHLVDLHIDRHIEAARQRGSPLRVLELGAGAGLPGILIAKVFQDVLVTTSDYPDESLIETLRENVKRNDVSERCRAIPYAWGSDPTPLFHSRAHGVSTSPGIASRTDKFDVIIAADTLWNPELHSLFLDTLRLTLRNSSDARIHLVAGLHTGRYTLQKFMDMIPDFNLQIERVEEMEVNGSNRRSWDITKAEVEDEQERRRWVVWLSLSARI